jgi:DNA-binding response OmpR family regulator
VTDPTVLVVDDEEAIAEAVRARLESEGYRVLVAGDGPEAIEICDEARPDLVVLDLMLPGMDGLEVCKIIQRERWVPVLMLTARTDESDKVAGFAVGADDYLTKPFSPKILVARVRALLRRAQDASPAPLAAGTLSLDVTERTLVGLPRGPVRLTPLELRFLQLLFAHAGRTVPTERLLVHVWGNRADGNRQLLKQLVHRLRNKIEDDPARPRLIQNMPNAGYSLDASQAQSSQRD